MPTALSLGPISFDAFEVPESIRFGGLQRIAKHRLLGGGAVLDTLGAEAAPVFWCGVFAGPNAGQRARQIDCLRAAGSVVTLLWRDFSLQVLVTGFAAEYRAEFWIPYRIVCAVIESQTPLAVAATVMAGTLSDLAAASAYGVNVAPALAAVSSSGATVAGTLAFAASQNAMSGVGAGIEAGMSSAAADLPSGDFSKSIAAAANLANLSAARGYVARATANLSEADA